MMEVFILLNLKYKLINRLNNLYNTQIARAIIEHNKAHKLAQGKYKNGNA